MNNTLYGLEYRQKNCTDTSVFWFHQSTSQKVIRRHELLMKQLHGQNNVRIVTAPLNPDFGRWYQER